jgi:hypothetical protein
MMEKQTVAVRVTGDFETFVATVEDHGCDWAVEGYLVVITGWPEDLNRLGTALGNTIELVE